jgi:NAD(P)-dependent dehydrogenase (short-subunit alcohol dehydrogenase family)
MKNKVCVVTGASSGIGRATACELARRGARVVLACRSRERSEAALTMVRDAGGENAAEYLELDLSSLAAVRRSATELLERGHPIHVLINNAGLAGRHGLTADAFELTFGVNHLGHFLFTLLLLDRIRESAPARIVTVASKVHHGPRGIDFEAIRRKAASRTAFPEYQVSELANVLFSAELGRRLAGTGVTTYALHPGVIGSNIWRHVPWPIRPIIKLFMRSNEEGASTVVRCATAPELASETGGYYDELQRANPSRTAQDDALARELWDRSASWCGLN